MDIKVFRILLRIITLPLAWVLWTINYSYKWIVYGGELGINEKTPKISPEEFMKILKEVSEKLDKFDN